MLFETITLTTVLLARSWIAWKSSKSANSVETAPLQETDASGIEDHQTFISELDKCQTERRNEIFLLIYSLLGTSKKSNFNQLSAAFKQLVKIYRILQFKLPDSEQMAEVVVADYENYVSSMKNSKVIIERFKELQFLLEYSFRKTDKDVLVYYYRDKGKDMDYIQNILPNIYGCFDTIVNDEFSKSNRKTKTQDVKNYKCLLGAAGRVYNDLVKVLYKYEVYDTRGRLSYELLYEISEYILKTTNFYFNKGLTTSRLAKDITDSIIHYIHNDVSVEEEFMENHADCPEKFVEKLIERYLLNREIESYYYFLKMSCKVLEALRYQNKLYGDNGRYASFNLKDCEKIAKEKLLKADLPILANIEESEILKDIEQAFEYKDAKLP